MSSFAIVARFLGAVLLLAGVATAYDGLDTTGSLPMVHSMGAVLGVAEIAFGLALLVGLYPRLAWWLLVGCFVTFLAASFDRAIASEPSCGCFGRIQVNPWYTFAFDVAALLTLAWVQPGDRSIVGRTGEALARTRRLLAIYGLLLLVAFIGVGASVYAANAHLADNGGADEGEVPLSPRDWVTRRFALARHIDVGPALAQGRWMLMLYHPECATCRTALPEFVGLAYHLANQERAVRLALIEMPRPGDPLSTQRHGGTCLRGHLSTEHRWHIRAPTFVALDGGTVTKVLDHLADVYQEVAVVRRKDDRGYLFPDYQQIRRQTFLKEIACGPLALMKVLDAFGKPLNEDEAERLLNEAGDKGIDMRRLKELAEQHGLHALGVAATPNSLRATAQRAIVHMDSVGFVPVLGYTMDGAIVAYPLGPPGVLPDDLFANSFGAEGKALLISDQSLDAGRLGFAVSETEGISGARLRPERSILAVGRLHRRSWEASLTLTNAGRAPLAIEKITTTSPSFTAQVSSKTLAPGETTELRAKGVQANLGSFTYHIVIATNDTDGNPLRIPVRGYLEQPVAFNPPVVSIRRLLPGQATDVEVQLELPAKVKFASLQVTPSTVGSLTAALLQRGSETALKVHWDGDTRPGTYRGDFKIVAANGADAVAATLPWVVEVLPTITAFPPSVCIESVSGGSWARELSLTSRRDLVGTPSIRWSDPAAAKVIKAEVIESTTRTLRVRLTGKRVARQGPTALTISAGDEAVIVPVLFIENRTGPSKGEK